MSESNIELLKQAIGEEDFRSKVELPAYAFNGKAKEDKWDARIQQFLAAVSFAISIVFAGAVAKQKVCLSNAVKWEIVNLIVWGTLHCAIQRARNANRNEMQGLLQHIQDAIPESERLIGVVALKEMQIVEAKIPEDPREKRVERFTWMGARAVIEKLIPYATALFS